MEPQRTLARAVTTRGIGVHSGRPVRVSVLPAPSGRAIAFVRTDLQGSPWIPARADHVVETTLATTLGAGRARVSTVEHLLAALAGLGIDNAVVEVDGPEIPILDGSAAPWMTLLRAAGRVDLDAPRQALVVDRRVVLTEGPREIAVEPAGRFEVRYEIDFGHVVIPPQTLDLAVDAQTFAEELAPARTFGFLAEVEVLKARGLARGGSLENAIVVGRDRILNPEGLRFADEFVRHKALDLVGDLALLSRPIRGRVTVARGGHRLHNRLVAALLADSSAWHLEGEAAPARRRRERARPRIGIEPSPVPA